MRSTALKMFTVLLGSVILLSTSSFKGPEKPAKPAKYTGYWIIKSGDEFIKVKKVDLPESAISKNAEGKMASFDVDMVKGKMNFNKEKSINGRQVDQHFFVATDEDQTIENSTDTHSLTSGKLNISNYALTIAQCAVISAYVNCWYQGSNYYITNPGCVKFTVLACSNEVCFLRYSNGSYLSNGLGYNDFIIYKEASN